MNMQTAGVEVDGGAIVSCGGSIALDEVRAVGPAASRL